MNATESVLYRMILQKIRRDPYRVQKPRTAQRAAGTMYAVKFDTMTHAWVVDCSKAARFKWPK